MQKLEIKKVYRVYLPQQKWMNIIEMSEWVSEWNLWK